MKHGVMKALLLNGALQGESTEKVHHAVENELKTLSYEIQRVNLSETEIAPCLGCFGCWVKTPGVCVINDAGRDVARAFIQSDIAVVLPMRPV